jgi:multicomponent Na+:H+ antiporter subunit G
MLLDVFTVLSVCAGLFFFLAGSVALLRFPDALSRLHGLTKADNPGLGLIVLGLLAQADSLAGGLKLVLVWLLVQFASASAGRLLARAAVSDAARDGRRT